MPKCIQIFTFMAYINMPTKMLFASIALKKIHDVHMAMRGEAKESTAD